jgi:hypothetical protein
MVDLALHQLAGATRHMALMLSLRLLPFAAYTALLPGTKIGIRLLVLVAYLVFPAVAVVLGAKALTFFIAAGSIYYLLVCLGVNRLSRLLAAGRVTRGGVLVIAFVAFLLLPGALLPGVAVFAFLVVGWELALSTYSYCVETSRPRATTASLGDCLFFLLVNPTVVYTVRGDATTAPCRGAGWPRAVAGAAIMFANTLMLRPLVHHVRSDSWLAMGTAAGLFGLLLYGLLQFLSFYAAHSGLAHIQIGLMRQVGWVVPERYRYPVLATSPMDFWRRWNTYFRLWLEAYVFLPLARRVARVSRRAWGQIAVAVLTLLASGLIHDAYTFAGHQNFASLQTTFFLGAGLLLAVWRVAALASASIRSRLDPQRSRAFDIVAPWMGRLGLGLAVAMAAAVWG